MTAGDPLVQLDARDYSAAVERARGERCALAQAKAALAKAKRERARTLRRQRRHLAGGARRPPRRGRHRRGARRHGSRPSCSRRRVNLEYTTLRAPRSGVILAKLKEVGEIAVPGGFSGSGDLIRMANLDDLRAEVDVTEAELGEVRMGQRAEVVPDAYPGPPLRRARREALPAGRPAEGHAEGRGADPGARRARSGPT